MFTVMVDFHLTPEGRERALRAMLEVAPLMRREPGVIGFDVLVPEDDADHLWFHETWTDRAAWEHHLANRPEPIALLARTIAAAFASPPGVSTFAVAED